MSDCIKLLESVRMQLSVCVCLCINVTVLRVAETFGNSASAFACAIRRGI